MRQRAWIWQFVLAIAAALPSASVASEPAQAFLDGLRERGYYDLALDYLNSLAQSPAAPPEFKRVLLYERGVTLVQGARLQRDAGLREQQLDEGQKALQQFIKDEPYHLLAISARSQLGSVLVERGRARVEKARKAAGAEKATLNKAARGLYDEASKVFTALVDELKEKLKSYPAALDEKKDAKRIEERDRYRQDYLQSQLLVAATREELTDALDPGSKEWTATLTTAADGYKKVYENYRTRLAGLYARMYQGRCFQKLGKHKEAAAFFSELLANPDTPDAFRILKLKCLALAVESWMAQELYLEVINRATPVVDAARAADAHSDEMMALRLTIGRACKTYAAQLKSKNPRDAEAGKLLSNGRKYVEYVTRFPSELQEPARKLLVDLTGNEAAGERKEPRNFAEAHTSTKDAIDALQAANLLRRTLPGRVAAAKGPEKADLQKQLDTAQKDATKNQTDALRYCRLAMQFADKQTSLDDINLIRYLLCYLLYNDGTYPDSAVVGEFLARRYPESQGARPSAKIAMASYLKLYSDNPSDDKEFESQRIVAIADYIVQKWPDQPEAAEAFNTLIPFMIREKKLAEAQKYLARIPADSPQRGTAELKTGQALWASYLENSRQVRDWETGAQPLADDVDLPARKKELEDLKTKAKQTLVSGVERMQKDGEISQVLATAVLSLAQIYIDTNEAAKAVQLLEDPKIGGLTLVRDEDPAVEREGVPEEIYKTALRAYISSLSGGGDAAAKIAKARGVMDALKERIGQTPEGQQKLVAIYVSLARDLQQQMEIADTEVKKSLGLGFESFLSQAGASATELDILNWVAETYRGMGESFGSDLKSLTPQAKGYFQKAAETYQKILDRGKADPQFMAPAMATQVRMQLAKSKKGMGDYIGARDIYESILKENAMLLPVQIEAARLYQDWGGAAKGQEDNYLRAIVGARPNPAQQNRNIIWGWGVIAKLAAGNAQFREQFHDARFNLALCRYNYALAQKDPAKKKEYLETARRDIGFTVGLYPDMGGEVGKAKYENLAKNVQKALGEKPVGLSAFQEPAAPPAGAASKTVPTSTPAKK